MSSLFYKNMIKKPDGEQVQIFENLVRNNDWDKVKLWH